MQGYEAETYGERIAQTYDELYPELAATDPMVDLLHRLAGPGPVLELGIGTGRVALPLARRGVEVHGIEASRAMVDLLRAKPDSNRLCVSVGDFSEVQFESRYSLIFAVFNTFFMLQTQEAQVKCFASVAERLVDDGVFFIEAFVPDPSGFDRGQRTSVARIGLDHVLIDVRQHDPVNQKLAGQHILVTEAGIKLYPVPTRYAWPSELDLMARLAGLRLRERWGGCQCEPFDARSDRHVSLYGR